MDIGGNLPAVPLADALALLLLARDQQPWRFEAAAPRWQPTMRRDEDEDAALRALVNGHELAIAAEKGRTQEPASVEASVASWAGNEDTRH